MSQCGPGAHAALASPSSRSHTYLSTPLNHRFSFYQIK